MQKIFLELTTKKKKKGICENLSAPKVIWLRSMQVRKNIFDFVFKVHRVISLSHHERILKFSKKNCGHIRKQYTKNSGPG